MIINSSQIILCNHFLIVSELFIDGSEQSDQVEPYDLANVIIPPSSAEVWTDESKSTFTWTEEATLLFFALYSKYIAQYKAKKLKTKVLVYKKICEEKP